MLPLLRKLYKEGSPEMAAALKRETLLYNTTPQCHPFIMGIACSMEMCIRDRLWSNVHIENTASIKTLEKVGFIREGHIRQGKMVCV